MPNKEIKLTKSSGNVFRDLGFANPEECIAKADLAISINKIIKEKGYTQTEAAEILGINQPKVSALSKGILSGFSLERLISFLNLLKKDVEIVVKDKPTRSKTQGRLNVVFTDAKGVLL